MAVRSLTTQNSPALRLRRSAIGRSAVAFAIGLVGLASSPLGAGGAGPCDLECPPAQTIALDDACRGLLPDLTTMVTADCGDPGPTTVTQDIPAGALIGGPQTVQVTLTAENGDGTVMEMCTVAVRYVDESPPRIDEAPQGGSVCAGQSFVFTVDALDTCGSPISYQWVKDGDDIVGAVDSEYVIASTDGTDSGLYAVRLTDIDDNSITSGEVALVVSDELDVAITADPPALPCGGGTVTLTADVTGTSGELTYLWSTLETTATIDVTEAGTYIVQVNDESGCDGVAEITVEADDSLAIAITADPPSLPCSGGTVTLGVDAPGATGDLTYLWSTLETTPTIEVTKAGTYIVGVMDEAGCEGEAEIEIVGGGLDPTPPNVTCPGDANVACGGSTDPADTGTATATDDCDPDPMVNFSDEVIAGSCPQSFTINRTWEATDGSGNSDDCVQVITVADTTAPTLTPGAIDPCFVDQEAAEQAALAATTADDDCSLASLDVDSIVDGCAIIVTVTGTDECGNSDSIDYETSFVTTAPVITAPDDVLVTADAGGCDALVLVPPLEITSECPATIVNDFTHDDDASGVYPGGDTLVTWTVTDACGNEQQVTQTITVVEANPFRVSMALELAEPLVTRCITFEFYTCPDAEPVVVRSEVTFTDGLATNVPITIPCGTFVCVSARDELHSLRRIDDDQFGLSPVVDDEYVADFTDNSGSGGDDDTLIGGNLNDNDFIEILDFATFVIRFGQTVGQSDCETPGPHPDLSGDGTVFSEDFTFIQINFLEPADEACCAMSGLTGDGGGEEEAGPEVAVSIEELRSRGLGHLAAADLNQDGWIDLEDIQAFMAGRRPAPRTISTHNAGLWSGPSSWSNGVPGHEIDVEIGGFMTLRTPAASAREVFVLPGAVLELSGAATLAATRLEVAAGGTLRVRDAGVLLSVGALRLDPGATLEWDGGTIEVAAGAFVPGAHDLMLTGRAGPNVLRLDNGAVGLVPGDTVVGNDPDDRGGLEIIGSAFATGRSLFIGVGGPGWLRVSGSSVVSAGDGFFVGREGVIEGAGLVEGSVRNRGRVAPDGTLEILGAFDQGTTGLESLHVTDASVLAIELGSFGHDRLVVTDAAALGGTLHVTLATGYTPRAGETFDVVRAEPIVDGFTELRLPRLPAGLEWAVDYGDTHLWLTVVRIAGVGSHIPQ